MARSVSGGPLHRQGHPKIISNRSPEMIFRTHSRADCCQHCCQGRSQLSTRDDKPGTSVQSADTTGRPWTTCPELRIRGSCPTRAGSGGQSGIAALARPVIRKVHQAAGGNPFFALEVARELARRGAPAAGEALPVPDDLRVLQKERLEAFPVATRAALLTVAATTRPTESLVQAASGLGGRAAAELGRAAESGIVEFWIGPGDQ
jgi:hypothetical protein